MVCFILTMIMPSMAYAEDPPKDETTTPPDISTMLPPLDVKLMYPDFPKLTLSCSLCTITPLTAGTAFTPTEDGIFLNKAASTHLLTWTQLSDSHLRLEVSYAMQRVRNQDLLYLGIMQDQVQRQQSEFALRERALMDQRDFALEQAKRRWYETPEFLIPVGIISGIALTLATGAIIKETWK